MILLYLHVSNANHCDKYINHCDTNANHAIFILIYFILSRIDYFIFITMYSSRILSNQVAKRTSFINVSFISRDNLIKYVEIS